MRAVPAALRNRLRLVPPPPGSRRVEIGCGWRPRPGYVHVDVEPLHCDIDFVTTGDRLPLPSQWADEILSVHMIEHVTPTRLEATVRHWFEVLRPGGAVVIHTPNAAAIGRALVAGDRASHPGFWPAISAVYGYGLHPADARGAGTIGGVPDHRIVFTAHSLGTLLAEAGFIAVEDVSGQDPSCHHTIDWKPFVPGLCLEMRALRPAGGRRP